MFQVLLAPQNIRQNIKKNYAICRNSILGKGRDNKHTQATKILLKKADKHQLQ